VDTLSFADVLALGDRLRRAGVTPVDPAKDVICYVEEWHVTNPEDFEALEAWASEDVTLVHVRERWQGDFFLLAGSYHTTYQRHESVGTYCSVSHPWESPRMWETHYSRGMLWLGFRHTHAFARVRLHTKTVVTPGETREDRRRAQWLAERAQAFQDAITLLHLPVLVDVDETHGAIVLRPGDDKTPFFCSWPDAFGPCQFEYNSTDSFEFLASGGRLAATCRGPVGVRAYLTGFSDEALTEFSTIQPPVALTYRCSVHCPFNEVPEVHRVIAPTGRLYTTLCEFQTTDLLPTGEDASAIVGVVGLASGYQIEMRLNRAPLPEEEMGPWLEDLLGLSMTYSPLPPFV
jgi:hypothetical protein